MSRLEKSKRRSLVVGGSRGLGLAIADDLTARGIPVTVASRSPPPGAAKGRVHISCDLSKLGEQGLGDLSDAVANSNVVFVVAARGCFGKFGSIAQRDAFDVMATTFVGNILVLSHAATFMAPGSSICWVSSLSAHATSADWAFYAASKAGVSHFVECIRPVASQRGISLTVAYPGNFMSGFHETAGARLPTNGSVPSELAGEIIDATIAGSSTWIAPMDREVLGDYLPAAQSARVALNEAMS